MVSEYIRVCRCGRWLGIMPSSWIVKFCMVLPFIGRSIQKDWLRRSHWTQPKKHAPSNVCVKMLPGSISSCCASGVDGASIKSTPTYPWLCNWYHRRTTRWGWCNVLFCTVLATEIKTAFGTIFFEKNCVQAAAEFKIIFCRILNLVLHCGDSVSLNRAVFRKGQVWGWLRNTSFLHSRIQHAKLGNQPFCFWNKHPDCDTGLGVIDGHSVEFIHSHTFHTLWMRESTVAPAWFQSVSFQRIPSNCTVFMLLFPFLVVKTENWSFCACFWCEPIRNTLADCHKKKKKKNRKRSIQKIDQVAKSGFIIPLALSSESQDHSEREHTQSYMSKHSPAHPEHSISWPWEDVNSGLMHDRHTSLAKQPRMKLRKLSEFLQKFQIGSIWHELLFFSPSLKPPKPRQPPKCCHDMIAFFKLNCRELGYFCANGTLSCWFGSRHEAPVSFQLFFFRLLQTKLSFSTMQKGKMAWTIGRDYLAGKQTQDECVGEIVLLGLAPRLMFSVPSLNNGKMKRGVVQNSAPSFSSGLTLQLCPRVFCALYTCLHNEFALFENSK